MHPNVPLINFAEPRITMRPEIQTIFSWFCKATLAQMTLEIAVGCPASDNSLSSLQYLHTICDLYCTRKNTKICLDIRLRRALDEICAPLGCDAAVVVILYRRFGTTYWSHLQGSKNKRTLDHKGWDCQDFDVLLTVHLSIILVINQLDAQNIIL